MHFCQILGKLPNLMTANIFGYRVYNVQGGGQWPKYRTEGANIAQGTHLVYTYFCLSENCQTIVKTMHLYFWATFACMVHSSTHETINN